MERWVQKRKVRDMINLGWKRTEWENSSCVLMVTVPIVKTPKVESKIKKEIPKKKDK